MLNRSKTATQLVQRQPRSPGQRSLSAVIRFVESTQQQQLRSDGARWSLWSAENDSERRSCAGPWLRPNGVQRWSEVFLCLLVEIPCCCVLVMDWMQWSFVPPAAGNAWPSVPQEFNETLALSTALGYSLLTCERCMLNYCFDSVSIQQACIGLISIQPVPRLKQILSDDDALKSLNLALTSKVLYFWCFNQFISIVSWFCWLVKLSKDLCSWILSLNPVLEYLLSPECSRSLSPSHPNAHDRLLLQIHNLSHYSLHDISAQSLSWFI